MGLPTLKEMILVGNLLSWSPILFKGELRIVRLSMLNRCSKLLLGFGVAQDFTMAGTLTNCPQGEAARRAIASCKV